jgi:hypothetical protein
MKNYITKAYIAMLHDKNTPTGTYFNTPKVIKRGVKYRKVLTDTQKDIYEELWDMTMKAAHKGQVDEKGRVFVEASDTFLAVALDVNPTTIKHNLNGKGKSGKYTELFDLGLIKIKKRVERETSEYYVMAPVYEGEDVKFLTSDPTTSSHIADAKALKEKRKKYSKTESKRDIENEQIAEERKNDSIVDTAEFEVAEREYQKKQEEVNETPNFDEVEEVVQLVAEVVEEPKETKLKPKPIRKYVEERYNDYTGESKLFGINVYANGSKEETDLYAKFPNMTHGQLVDGFRKKGFTFERKDLTKQ